MSFHLYDTHIFVVAGTTTRTRGFSTGNFASNNFSFTVGDDPKMVLKNREVLADQLNTTLNDWVFVKQCHSDQFKKVGHDDGGKGAYQFEDGIEGVDALYSFDKNCVLAFFHADCVPILFYDETTNLIGAIHSGYEGTLKEITRKTLSHVIEHEKIDPNHLKVIIGPCLSFENSHYKGDVDAYLTTMKTNTQGFIEKIEPGYTKIDTRQLNIQMCLDCQIPLENITNFNHDTYTEEDIYYSYERDQETGRHLSFIMQV